MSYQATEAIQDHSKVTDPVGLAIFMAIGRYADRSGFVGKQGISPSIKTLADKARVHRNTVGRWLGELEEMGELEVIRPDTKGRGRSNQYKILLPIDSNNEPPIEQRQSQIEAKLEQLSNAIDRLITAQEKAQAEQIKAQQIAQQALEKAQEKAHNSTAMDVHVTKRNKEEREETPLAPLDDSNEQTKTARVLKHFCNKTDIQPPPQHAQDKWRLKWIFPLNELLEMSGDDVNQTAVLIDQTIAYMQHNGLTYSQPASLVNVARRLNNGVAKIQSGGMGLG